jgi:site-specific recombinase XerD
MKREALPTASVPGEDALGHYEQELCSEEDLSTATIWNYLSDVYQFAVWDEGRFLEGQEDAVPFTPTVVAMPILTACRTYLQQILHLKPASVNRSLIGFKCYVGWLTETGKIKQDSAKVVEQEGLTPRQLNDQALEFEEEKGNRL